MSRKRLGGGSSSSCIKPSCCAALTRRSSPTRSSYPAATPAAPPVPVFVQPTYPPLVPTRPSSSHGGYPPFAQLTRPSPFAQLTRPSHIAQLTRLSSHPPQLPGFPTGCTQPLRASHLESRVGCTKTGRNFGEKLEEKVKKIKRNVCKNSSGKSRASYPALVNPDP